MINHLERLARRVASDPAFLAFGLAIHAHSEQLDDAALAAKLGCSVETLTMLRLCRAPVVEPAGFARDIDQIATRFGVRANELAAIVRRAQVLSAFRAESLLNEGTLLAARDDPERPESES